MFGPFLSFFGEFEDFESLLKFLFQIGDSLSVLLGQFESQSEFCSLVGHVPGEFGDFVIEYFFVIMRPFEGTIQFVILVFEPDEGLIAGEFDEDLLELFFE